MSAPSPPQGRSSQNLTDQTLRGQSVPTLSLLESLDAAWQGLQAGVATHSASLSPPTPPDRDSTHEQVCALATTGHVFTRPHRPDSPGSECVHTRPPWVHRRPRAGTPRRSSNTLNLPESPGAPGQGLHTGAGLRPCHHRAGPHETSQTRPSGVRVCPLSASLSPLTPRAGTPRRGSNTLSLPEAPGAPGQGLHAGAGLRPCHHRAGPHETSQTQPSGVRVCPHSASLSPSTPPGRDSAQEQQHILYHTSRKSAADHHKVQQTSCVRPPAFTRPAVQVRTTVLTSAS
jgi:hypothetical protein